MGMTSSTVSRRCSTSETVNLYPLLSFGMGTITRGGYGEINCGENIKMIEEGVDVEAFMFV